MILLGPLPWDLAQTNFTLQHLDRLQVCPRWVQWVQKHDRLSWNWLEPAVWSWASCLLNGTHAGVHGKLPAKGSLNGSWNGETPPSLFGWKSLQEANPAAMSFYKVRFFFSQICVVFSFFLINCFNWRLITLQYCSGFCHTLTWISHGCTCVPHPEPPSHLPPHPIPQGHPSAPALSTLSHAFFSITKSTKFFF